MIIYRLREPCQSPIGLGFGFREAGRLGLPEPLLHVTAERVDEQQLASGAVGLVVAVHPASDLRLDHQHAFGGPIAGPGEALAVHQGLQ